MWRLWSRGLELLGRFRLPRPPSRQKTLRVGDPTSPDARGGFGWHDFLDAERLYDVWGPLPESVWVPFHCVPLFAAVDSLERWQIGPTAPAELQDGSAEPEPPLEPAATGPAAVAQADDDVRAAPNVSAATGLAGSDAAARVQRRRRPPLPAAARPGAPAPIWLQQDTWTILDVPGPTAVEAAAWLVGAGCQPVCTFDNWPHPRGVLRSEATLAELLRWATTIADLRRRLRSGSPPLWICDSERLGNAPPRPRDFDNRYYLDDSILPGPEMLRRAGIRRMVYVTLEGRETPLPDLDAHFRELIAAGFRVLQASLLNSAGNPTSILLPPLPRRPPSKFSRSSAGGFGKDVPDPSSGGGGG
jgi:hypothetical protein